MATAAGKAPKRAGVAAGTGWARGPAPSGARDSSGAMPARWLVVPLSHLAVGSLVWCKLENANVFKG